MGDRSPGDPEVAAILRRLGLPEFEDKLRDEQIDLFALTLMKVPHFQRLGMQFDKAVDLQKYVAENVPDGTARATDRSVSDRAVSDTDSGGETQRMDGNLTTSTATRVGINIERTDLQTVSALTLSAEEDSTEDADSVRARDADFARSAELGMDTTWETMHTAIRDTTELLVISLQPDEVENSPYQQLVARGGKIIRELVATIVEQEYSVLYSIGECADLAHSANSTEVLAKLYLHARIGSLTNLEFNKTDFLLCADVIFAIFAECSLTAANGALGKSVTNKANFTMRKIAKSAVSVANALRAVRQKGPRETYRANPRYVPPLPCAWCSCLAE